MWCENHCFHHVLSSPKKRVSVLALSPKYLSQNTSVTSINRPSDENGRGLGTGQWPLLHGYLAVLMSTAASFLPPPVYHYTGGGWGGWKDGLQFHL